LYGVAPFGDPSYEADNPSCLLASRRLLLQESETFLQVCLGKSLSEPAQDVVCVFAASAETTEFPSENLGLEECRAVTSSDGKGWWGIKFNGVRTGDDPGPKPD
jgi:hypothetical protein